MTIRAISLWQPFASLVAYSLKQYETRHWPTHYRGLLAIHASKRWGVAERTLTHDFAKRDDLFGTALNVFGALPLGAIVCVVKLVDCVPVESIRHKVRQRDLWYGDWSDGRFAWKLELVEQFAVPIPEKGRQGFWSWEMPR